MRAIAVALLLSFLGACQSVDDTPVATTPIQAILVQGKDDQQVRVRGEIVSKVDDERYVIGDGTGTIQARIDDDLARKAALGIGTRVEILGEVDTNISKAPTIRAKRVAVLTQ